MKVISGFKLSFNFWQLTGPSAPMLTAQPPTPDNLTVSWSVRKGADSYNATLFDDNRAEVIGVGGVGSTTATNLTLTNLQDGTNYYLQVCSVNSAGSTCGEIAVTGCEFSFRNPLYHCVHSVLVVLDL